MVTDLDLEFSLISEKMSIEVPNFIFIMGVNTDLAAVVPEFRFAC